MNESTLRRGRQILLGTALALFVFTVVVGILNGTDLLDPEHKVLMTHVHSGTLGWISLGVLAAAMTLFAGGATGWRAEAPRWLPTATAVAVVAYVAGFLTTTGVLRPILGTGTLVVVAVWLAWVWQQRTAVVLSVPRLAVLAAITSLAIGAVLGILLGIELSGEADTLPDGAEGSHPAAMVIGFLIPIGMALAEWRLRPDLLEVPADRAGRLQVLLPFVGGILVMVGLLLDAVPLVALSLPFEVVGVGILVRRMWPALGAIDWRTGWERGGALTLLYLVLNIALFVYLIGRYEGEIDDAPRHLLLALDHIMFIGVMTNSLFGLVAAEGRRVARSAVDDWILPAMNVGLVLFVVGLLGDWAAPKRIGTPIMGTAILVAIAVLGLRLFDQPGEGTGPPSRHDEVVPR